MFAPKWDNAINYANDTINNVVCYSVPLTETREGKWYMNIALTNKGNNAEYVHFRKFASSANPLSGVLNYYTIYGSFKESEILKDGKINYTSRDKVMEGSDTMAEDNTCTDTRGLTLSCGGNGPGDGDGVAFSVTYSGPEIVVTASRPDPIIIGNIGDRGGSIPTGGSYSDGSNISYGCGGSALAPKDIVNGVNDPCIKKAVDYALNNGLKNELSKTIQKVFGGPGWDPRLDIMDYDPLTGKNPQDLDGQASFNPITNVAHIQLNRPVLKTAAKEYIAVTLLHEAIHTVMEYKGKTYDLDHSDMALFYVEKLADALIEMFPSLPREDAIAMSWGGLSQTTSWFYLQRTNTALANKYVNINNQYRNNNKGLSPCK